MNSSQTKWLVGLALALFAFIAFDELRRPSGPPPSPAAGQLVPRLRPATVTRIEVTLSNATIRAEFAAGQWRLTAPLSYPADPLLISALLEICSSRRPQVIIPAAQVKSPPTSVFSLRKPPSGSIKVTRPSSCASARAPRSTTRFTCKSPAAVTSPSPTPTSSATCPRPLTRGVTARSSAGGVKFDRLRVHRCA